MLWIGVLLFAAIRVRSHSRLLSDESHAAAKNEPVKQRKLTGTNRRTEEYDNSARK